MEPKIVQRIAVAFLTLSALGFSATVSRESFTPVAVVPVKGDPPTYGFGATTKEDGTPVTMADKIDPPGAVRLAVKDMAAKEATLRSCFAGAELAQYEWDAYVDLAYNVGAGAVCRSSIPAKTKRGDYEAACLTILDFKRVHGVDCSLLANRHYCGGVWTRRKAMAHQCLTGERA